MQMLLVWNLTEIDVNEPDKVLIVVKVACEYIVSITLSRQLTFTVNINLQTDRKIGVGGGGVSEGGSLTISMSRGRM